MNKAFFERIFDSRSRSILFVLASIPIALVLGLGLGKYVLPLLQAVLVFPLFAVLVRKEEWRRALFLMCLWAAGLALTAGVLSFVLPDFMGERILNGVNYRQEMFAWVATGEGKEGNISLFFPEHLAHLGGFVFVTSVSGGLLGLVMGAALMNYMAFYTGGLLAKATSPLVLLLCWPPWAVFRVIAFITLAIPLSAILLKRSGGKLFFEKRMSRYFFAGSLLWSLDILLKWSLAARWQDWLQECTLF